MYWFNPSRIYTLFTRKKLGYQSIGVETHKGLQNMIGFKRQKRHKKTGKDNKRQQKTDKDNTHKSKDQPRHVGHAANINCTDHPRHVRHAANINCTDHPRHVRHKANHSKHLLLWSIGIILSQV